MDVGSRQGDFFCVCHLSLERFRNSFSVEMEHPGSQWFITCRMPRGLFAIDVFPLKVWRKKTFQHWDGRRCFFHLVGCFSWKFALNKQPLKIQVPDCIIKQAAGFFLWHHCNLHVTVCKIRKNGSWVRCWQKYIYIYIYYVKCASAWYVDIVHKHVSMACIYTKMEQKVCNKKFSSKSGTTSNNNNNKPVPLVWPNFVP